MNARSAVGFSPGPPHLRGNSTTRHALSTSASHVDPFRRGFTCDLHHDPHVSRRRSIGPDLLEGGRTIPFCRDRGRQAPVLPIYEPPQRTKRWLLGPVTDTWGRAGGPRMAVGRQLRNGCTRPPLETQVKAQVAQQQKRSLKSPTV